MTGDAELFAHVDWPRTKAYALGLNSLYLNRHAEVETQDTLSEIQSRLLSLR